MKPLKIPIYVIVSLGLLLVVSLVGVSQRYREEARNRSICIVAEDDAISNLSASRGIPVSKALDSLYADGLRGVVLTEETIGNWVSEGRVTAQTVSNPKIPAGSELKIVGQPGDMAILVQAVSARFSNVSALVGGQKTYVLFPNLSSSVLRNVSLGIDPYFAKRALAHHMVVIARLGNPVGIDRQGIMCTIALAHDRGASIFLPQGDQVLGRRDAIPDMILALEQNQMLYGDIEFSKMGGNSDVIEQAPQIVVRLHSALAAELDKDTLPAAVERYTKAARERNMRVLLLRPVDYASQNPLQDFGHFVQSVARGVVKQGQKIGPPHPFTAPSTPRIYFPILGLCIVPIAWWLASVFIPVITLPVTAITILLALAAASSTHRNYIALEIALLVPIVCFLSIDTYPPKPVFLSYFRTCVVSLIGGLAVAAMLSQLSYYVQAQEFQGVKLAVFLPILLALWYFLLRFCDLKKLGREPISIVSALLGIVLLSAITYMFLRTGNDNPAAVSPVELHMRNLLDHFFFVRPRTKSFLIGLPALYIALKLLAKLKKDSSDLPRSFGAWTALALAVAMVSQTDIVNTFCHIHTPVLLSIERIGIEFVVGALFGIILWSIINVVLSKTVPNYSGTKAVSAAVE